jgi:hypothetical protein
MEMQKKVTKKEKYSKKFFDYICIQIASLIALKFFDKQKKCFRLLVPSLTLHQSPPYFPSFVSLQFIAY